LLFLLHISDLPKICHILFTDVASVLFTHPNPIHLNTNIYKVFTILNSYKMVEV